MPCPLPIEVVERSLDFLWNDPRTLSRCALVCKEWLPRCRYHFLHMIHLPDRKAFDHLREASFSTDPLATYLPMRDVTLRVIEDDRSPYVHTIPHTLARRLRPLTFISITKMDWRARPPHSTFFMMMGETKSLTHLCLSHCRFRRFQDLKRIIGAILALEDLRLHNVSFGDQPVATRVPADFSDSEDESFLPIYRRRGRWQSSHRDSPRKLKRPALACLIARDCPPATLLHLISWIRESPSFNTITILEMTSDGEDDSSWREPFVQLVRRIFVQLQHLGHSLLYG